MFQKIKQFIVVGLVGLTMFVPAIMPIAVGTASADTIAQNLCSGANSATTGTGSNSCGSNGTDANGTDGIKTLASKVVNIFSVIVGVVAVIFIIYGGFRYITSGGDSGSVGNAKNTLIYALVGLVIVALAQFIVHYVINTAVAAGGTQ